MGELKYVYRIRHKKTERFFTNRHGVTLWAKTGSAKLSFNQSHGSFKDQTEWECVAFLLVEHEGAAA